MGIFDIKHNRKLPKGSTDNRSAGVAKKQRKQGGKQLILLHVLGIIALSVVLVLLTLGWLKIYTRHYNSVTVPAIQGMSQEEAIATLKKEHLYMEVVDSVYNEALEPGVIIETTPAAGSVIKDRRTIYVVINNMQVKKSIIPDVHEISRRQAEALIRRAGFTDLRIKFVPGEYNNLALRIKDQYGRILTEGIELPFNDPLILEVSSRELLTDSLRMLNDSLMLLQQATPSDEQRETPQQTTGGDDESWF